jgi:hypothetical protein
MRFEDVGTPVAVDVLQRPNPYEAKRLRVKRHIDNVKLSADFIASLFHPPNPAQRTRERATAIMEWHFAAARRRSDARAYPRSRAMLHS